MAEKVKKKIRLVTLDELKKIESKLGVPAEELTPMLDKKQEKLKPGKGIQITSDNTINVIEEGQKLTAGENIFIDSQNRINARFMIPKVEEGGSISIDPSLPKPITSFRSETSDNGNDIILSWVIPKDNEKTTGVLIVKNIYRYPADMDDGTPIYKGSAESFTDTNVTKGEFAYYRAFTYTQYNVYNTDASQVVRHVIKIKPAAPETPEAEDIDSKVVIIRQVPLQKGELEYRLGEDGIWTSSRKFVSLLPETSYSIYARVKAGETNLASDASAALTVKTKKDSIYTIIIDTENTDPERAVTYADDAINFTTGGEDLENIIKPKLVLLSKTGEEKELDPMNLNQFTDGTFADTVSGNAGDVMVRFPLIGYKYEYKGTKLHVSITLSPNIEGFSYKAFQNGETIKDKLYISAFYAMQINGTLQSLAYNYDPLYRSSEYTTSRNIVNEKKKVDDYMRGKGENWHILSYYQILLLNTIFMIKFKSISLTKLPSPYNTSFSYSNYRVDMTQYYKIPKPSGVVSNNLFKFMYLWNFYKSDCRTFIPGIRYEDNKIYVKHINASEELSIDAINTGTSSAYISHVNGTNDFALLPSKLQGSSSTYWTSGYSISGFDPSIHTGITIYGHTLTLSNFRDNYLTSVFLIYL